MTTMTVDQLSAEAAEIVAKNPPTRVALTCFLGVFAAVGWIAGRTWISVAGLVTFCAIAVKVGYRAGARVQVTPKTTTRPTRP